MGNWSMAVNLAGVTAINPMNFGADFERGLYEGTIIDSDRKDKDGKTKIDLIVELGGKYAGRQVHVWINDLEKAANKGFLRNILECKGTPVAVLDGAGFNINQDTFKNVKVNVLVEPREPNADGTKPYPNINIISPAHVEQVKKNLASGNGASAAVQTPVAAQPGAAAGMAAAANAMGATVTV